MATNEGTAPGLPEQFGRYRVLRKLGDGGMGAVYLATNTELQREEALKVPSFGDDDAADRRERFLREARAAAKLDHPNICSVYDVGELDGVLYMTMRYLKGRPLSDYTGAPQPMQKSAEVVTKLAQALVYAHDRGVIHRDVKPGNVMMVANVGPVLMDFGLAKQTRQADKALTHRRRAARQRRPTCRPSRYEASAGRADRGRLQPRRHPVRAADGSAAVRGPDGGGAGPGALQGGAGAA